MALIKTALLCGGRSAEHEISLLSAKNVIDAIDRERFEPYIIGIEKTGRWLLEDTDSFLLNANDPKKIKLNPEGVPVALPPHSCGKLCRLDGKPSDITIDAVFPILHGPGGEDGTVQGLLRLAEVPFVGAGVLGSAVGMDKDVMKRLLRDAGIRIGDFICIRAGNNIPSFNDVCGKLGTPVFVKPANMGSSIGVRKVRNDAEWREAVREAFEFDTKIVAEANITGREIECAVLEENGLLSASVPGEIISAHDFYSYDAKYIDANGARLMIPADLPANLCSEIQECAKKTFTALCCAGPGRVDFFIAPNEEIFVNEINTLPGFTAISMYPKLFGASGIEYGSLIARLIDSAIKRFQNEARLKTSYL